MDVDHFDGDAEAGLAAARAGDHDAAVVHGDPADIERLLDPVARGRAERVIGVRPERPLADRALSSLIGTLAGGEVFADAASPFGAYSRAALSGRPLTPIEIPVRGRYAARASWRRSLTAMRTASATPVAPASTNGKTEPGSYTGNTRTSGPHGASGSPVTSEPPPSRTSA
jgi:hypothetical protein